MGFLAHDGKGSSVHFTGDTHALFLLVSKNCWRKSNTGILAACFLLYLESLCTSQAIYIHWICWFPGLLDGREELASGLLRSYHNEKLCAVPRISLGTGCAGFLVPLMEEKNWNLGFLLPDS